MHRSRKLCLRSQISHHPLKILGDPPQTPAKIERTFDALDRPTAVTQTAQDGTVLTRTLAYDYLGRQTDESDGRGGSLHFEYDGNGNRTLRKLTLPGGQVKTVSYGYDGRNRLSKVTDEAGTTSYTYGCRGNLVTHVTRPDGSVEDYGYDDADRLTSKAAGFGGQNTQLSDRDGQRKRPGGGDPAAGGFAKPHGHCKNSRTGVGCPRDSALRA